MRQPTLKQLRYLCAVAEHQHFGQAASACHVSQSTLSAGIGELEDALGVSLVERNNRRVFLTLLGEEVVERARISWSTWRTWCRSVREPERRFRAACGWASFQPWRRISCRAC